MQGSAVKALGVDVGLRKGLDLVLLADDRAVLEVRTRVQPEQLLDIARSLRPEVIAIDSPPLWAPAGGRETEGALRRLNLQLYATPTEERCSQKGFHDWMLVAMRAFAAVAWDYPLFGGGSALGHSMEVFPHASAVVLAGHIRPRETDKTQWRLDLLRQQHVTGSLPTADSVDAAMAALTGMHALEGNFCWFGKPEEGVIVLPCQPDRLPLRFLPRDARLDLALPPSDPSLDCPGCLFSNPPGSRFCNQCGAKLTT